MALGGIIEIMSKKKRDKKYKGGAAAFRPTVTKVSAVRRNPVHQWWIDHKQVARPVLIASGIAIVVLVCIIGLIDIIW